jgi:GNAT superfamily N-acetyltransferase
MKIETLEKKDLSWAESLLQDRWGAPAIVTRGVVHRLNQLDGFIAIEAGQYVGLITYNMRDEEFEIVSLDSLKSGKRIGRSLVNAVLQKASVEGCSRVWLVTTNDNTDALCFYQKVGFKLVAVYRDAIKESRRLKTGIPHIGNDGIPIRDEIELEIKT